MISWDEDIELYVWGGTGQGTQAALQFAKMQSRECAAQKCGVKVASKCASGTPQCSAEITITKG